MIVRIRCFTSYLCSTKSLASASNSSGLVGGLVCAQVVLGLDQAAAQEVPPDAVDQRPGEVRVVRRRQPVGEVLRGGRVGLSSGSGLPSSGVGGMATPRRRCSTSPSGCDCTEHLAGAVAVLERRPRRTGWPCPSTGPASTSPAGGCGSGAGDRHAQERDRGRLGQVGDVLVQHEVVGRAVLQRAAAGGEDLAGEAVPRLVVGHALADELVERPHRRLRQLAARDQQQVGPLVRPVIDELRPLQQARRSASPACRAPCRRGTPCTSSGVGRMPAASR